MICIVATLELSSEVHLNEVVEELAYICERKDDVSRSAVGEVLLL